MWPFTTKEPLNSQKLPVPNLWGKRNGHDPLGRSIVRVHTGYSKFKSVTGNALHVAIAVPMLDTTREGLPKSGEAEAFTRIENDICEDFENNRESLLVGTPTIPGICEFILYTQNPDAVQRKFDNDLLARIFTHKVHLKIQPDKDWHLYEKLL